MTREIKFRAWTGNSIEYFDLLNVPVAYLQSGDLFDDGKTRFILMQFTDLKDKNGIDIYEGDIISSDWSDDWVTHKIIYNNNIAGFQAQSLDTEPEEFNLIIDLYNIIVIGNIYENPDLLGE